MLSQCSPLSFRLHKCEGRETRSLSTSLICHRVSVCSMAELPKESKNNGYQNALIKFKS